MYMRRIILSYLAWPTLQYFSTFSQNDTIFETSNDKKACVLFTLQILSEIFPILRKT